MFERDFKQDPVKVKICPASVKAICFVEKFKIRVLRLICENLKLSFYVETNGVTLTLTLTLHGLFDGCNVILLMFRKHVYFIEGVSLVDPEFYVKEGVVWDVGAQTLLEVDPNSMF